MLKNHLQAVIDKFKMTDYELGEGVTPTGKNILIFKATDCSWIDTDFKYELTVAIGGDEVVFIEGPNQMRNARRYTDKGKVEIVNVPPFVLEHLWPGQEKPKADQVCHPSHYNTGKIEVAEFIEDQQLDWHLGTVIKYVCRAGRKDPTKEIEDLEKAEWYLRRKLELMRAAKEGRAPCRPNDMVKK